MTHILRRIRDWAVGPGGWLIDSDLDDQLSAVDIELDQLEQANRTGDATDVVQAYVNAGIPLPRGTYFITRPINVPNGGRVSFEGPEIKINKPLT